MEYVYSPGRRWIRPLLPMGFSRAAADRRRSTLQLVVSISTIRESFGSSSTAA